MKFNLTGRFIFCSNKEIRLNDNIQIFHNLLACSTDRRSDRRSEGIRSRAAQGRAAQRSYI